MYFIYFLEIKENIKLSADLLLHTFENKNKLNDNFNAGKIICRLIIFLPYTIGLEAYIYFVWFNFTPQKPIQNLLTIVDE